MGDGRVVKDLTYLGVRDAHLMVRRHIAQNAAQSSDFNRAVIWDDFMVFSVFLGGNAKVRPCLAGHLIAKLAERLDELRPGEIPRRPHGAKTSSPTK